MTDGQMQRWKDGQTVKRKVRRKDRQTDGRTDRQTNIKQTGRQKSRLQTDRRKTDTTFVPQIKSHF